MKKPLRIASRKSPLALWQANYVRNLLLGKTLNKRLKLIRTPLRVIDDSDKGCHP